MAQATINNNSVQPNGLPDTGDSAEMGDSWNQAVAKLNANFTELYALTPVGGTPGVVTASKAIVVDANKAITGMGSITFADGSVIDFGASGGLTVGLNATRRVGFFGVAPVPQDATLAAITTTAPIATFGWGFATSQQATLAVAAINQLVANQKVRGWMAS